MKIFGILLIVFSAFSVQAYNANEELTVYQFNEKSVKDDDGRTIKCVVDYEIVRRVDRNDARRAKMPSTHAVCEDVIKPTLYKENAGLAGKVSFYCLNSDQATQKIEDATFCE